MGINNRDGALWMATGIDNSGLYSGFNQAENRVDQFEAHIKRVGDNITRLTGIGFGIAGLKAFSDKIVDVRGEMQLLETSFGVLLGNEAKANAMLAEIKQYNIQSPLSLNGISQAAQLLLGFNVEAEKVMPTLKQLGDISMGDTGRFQSLALAFAQMSAAGKLMGQDLLQMINAGFNPLQEISKNTGKSLIELRKEMENGSISSEMVAEAFASATAEGGKFYGMTEKQAEGIRGLQAKLEGGLIDAFNKVGKSQEDLIAGGYKLAISLVDNYQVIGEALTALIATYGIAKAAMVFNTSIDKTVTVMRYEAEIAELTKLLPLKEQEANADLKAAVASGKLTDEKAKLLIALRAEVESRRESIQSKLAEEQSNLKVLYSKRAEAKEALELARTKTIAAKEDLANAIASAQAEAESALQNKMALESEKQSRAALRIVKLQEQKDIAITQATALKEKGVSMDKIATKNKEIASIQAKIVAARQEEIQHGRNVAAARAEIKASVDVAANKNIQTLTNKVNTLSEKENAAAITHNGLIKQTVSGKILIKKIATDADTASTVINTAVTNANTTSTNILTVAKTRLISVAKNLLTAIAPNPYVLAAAAVVALGYGIYKLTTRTTELEQAQKRVNSATKDFQGEVASERAQIDILFGRLKSAKEGTEKYQKAKDEIISKYGKYLDGLNAETKSLHNVSEAYKAITENAIKAAKARALEAGIEKSSKAFGESYSENITKIQNAFLKKYGNEKGTKFFSRLQEQVDMGLNVDQMTEDVQAAISLWDDTIINEGSGDSKVVNYIKSRVSAIAESRKVFEDENKKLNNVFDNILKSDDKAVKEPTIITYSDQVEKAKDDVSKLKKELENLQKGVRPSNLKENEQFDFAKGIEEKAKSLKEAKDKLSFLITGQSSSDNGKAESAAEKSLKQAQDQADKELKIENDRIKTKFDLRSRELENEQALLNNQQDSFDKQQQQNELNYKKESLALERHMQELIETAQKAERDEWNLKNPKGSKTPFKTKINTLSDLPDVVQTLEIQTDTNNNQAYIKATSDTLKTLLDLYQDYNEQRRSINEKYDNDLIALESQYAKVTTDEEKGRIDAAIAQLKKKWSEALSSVNIEELKESINWEQVFGDLDKVSTNELIKLRDKLRQYLSSIGDSLSAQDLKIITDAFDALNEKITDKKPISELKDGYSGYKKAVEDVIKVKKELLRLEKGTPEHVAATKKLKEAEDSRRENLVKMNQAINKMGSTGSEMVNSGQELIGMLTNLGVKMPEAISGALDGIGQIMGGLEKFDLTKPASIITSAVSVISGIGNTIAGIFGGGVNKLGQEFFDRYDKMMSYFDKLIEKQKDLLSGLSGKEALDTAKETAKQLEDQLDYNKKQALEFLKSSGSTTTYGRRQFERLKQYRKELSALGIDLDSLGDRLENVLDLSLEQLENLQKNPQIWAQFNEETQNFIQAAIDAKKELGDLSGALNESLTGVSFDALKDSLDDLVTMADLTFSDISDSFEDHMSTAILRMVKSKYLTSELEKWYDQFAQYSASGGELTADEVSELQGKYKEIVENTNKQYKEAMDLAGLELDKDTRSASEKGFAQASQDSVDYGIGILNNISVHTLSIKDNVAGLHEASKSFIETYKETLNTWNSILEETKAINKNTQELYGIKSDMSKMNETLDSIKLHGIPLKKE